MTNFCVEKKYVVIFSGWAPEPTGVIHRPEGKFNQNVFKFMWSTFLSRGFSAFLTAGTVLKSLHNDSPEPGDELKKKSDRKKYFFRIEKDFQKKVEIFFQIFRFFKIQTKNYIFEKIK